MCAPLDRRHSGFRSVVVAAKRTGPDQTGKNTENKKKNVHAVAETLDRHTGQQGRRRNAYGAYAAVYFKNTPPQGDTCVLARDAVHTGVIKLAGYAPGTRDTRTRARACLLLLLAVRTAQRVRNRRRTLHQSALAIAYDGPVAPTFRFRVCVPPIQRFVSIFFFLKTV